MDDPRHRPLLTAGITAFVPLLLGDPVLTSLGRDVELPLMGTVYASTTLVFDIGVYLVVVGLIFMIFEAFGEDERQRRTPDRPTRGAA